MLFLRNAAISCDCLRVLRNFDKDSCSATDMISCACFSKRGIRIPSCSLTYPDHPSFGRISKMVPLDLASAFSIVSKQLLIAVAIAICLLNDTTALFTSQPPKAMSGNI